MAELLKLTCSDCGAPLHIEDNGRAVCAHCGQTYLIDEAGGLVLDVKVDFGNAEQTKKTIKKTKNRVIAIMCVAAVFVLVAFLLNSEALKSKWFMSDWDFLGQSSLPVKKMCEDIFDKSYHQITKEELASIKYIKHSSQRIGSTDSWLHIYEYSLTDYRDCESEEEFQETIKQWTYQDTLKQTGVNNYTMLTGLTRVCINSQIQEYRFSKKAEISYVESKDYNMGQIADLVDPKKVEIVVCRYDWEDDFDELDKFENLEELDVRLANYHAELDCTIFEDCKNLKKLKLKGAVEKLVNLKSLKKHSGLESLYLEDATIEDCGFITEFTQLKELTIDGGDEPDLSFLDELPQLESLELLGDEVDVEQLSHLHNLENLEHLSIGINQRESIEEIAKLENLQTLTLRMEVPYLKDERVPYYEWKPVANFTPLTNLTRLENLSLILEPESSDDMEIYGVDDILNALPLKRFQINNQYDPVAGKLGKVKGIMCKVDPSVTIENQTLEELWLVDCILTDENTEEPISPEILTGCTKVRILTMDYAELTDISFLPQFTELRACSIVGNQITDFTPLKDCKKLSVIGAYDNPGGELPVSKEVTVLNNSYEGVNLTDHLDGVVVVVGYIKKQETEEDE